MITDYYYYFYYYYVKSCHIKILYFCVLLFCNGTYCIKNKIRCWRWWWRGLTIMEIDEYCSLHWFLLRIRLIFISGKVVSRNHQKCTFIERINGKRGKPRWWMSFISIAICIGKLHFQFSLRDLIGSMNHIRKII